jgi:hypothetical protein
MTDGSVNAGFEHTYYLSHARPPAPSEAIAVDSSGPGALAARPAATAYDSGVDMTPTSSTRQSDGSDSTPSPNDNNTNIQASSNEEEQATPSDALVPQTTDELTLPATTFDPQTTTAQILHFLSKSYVYFRLAANISANCASSSTSKSRPHAVHHSGHSADLIYAFSIGLYSPSSFQRAFAKAKAEMAEEMHDELRYLRHVKAHEVPRGRLRERFFVRRGVEARMEGERLLRVQAVEMEEGRAGVGGWPIRSEGLGEGGDGGEGRLREEGEEGREKAVVLGGIGNGRPRRPGPGGLGPRKEEVVEDGEEDEEEMGSE